MSVAAFVVHNWFYYVYCMSVPVMCVARGLALRVLHKRFRFMCCTNVSILCDPCTSGAVNCVARVFPLCVFHQCWHYVSCTGIAVMFVPQVLPSWVLEDYGQYLCCMSIVVLCVA